MRFTVPLLLLSLLAPPAGAQEAPLPSVELPPGFDRVLRDYERAWAAGDGPGLAALFTADGFIGSDAGWIRGTEAIVTRYARVAGGPLRLRAHAWAVEGAVGYIVGAYGYGADSTEWEDRGKFLLALRRGSDDRWLIAADLDNSNR